MRSVSPAGAVVTVPLRRKKLPPYHPYNMMMSCYKFYADSIISDGLTDRQTDGCTDRRREERRHISSLEKKYPCGSYFYSMAQEGKNRVFCVIFVFTIDRFIFSMRLSGNSAHCMERSVAIVWIAQFTAFNCRRPP